MPPLAVVSAPVAVEPMRSLPPLNETALVLTLPPALPIIGGSRSNNQNERELTLPKQVANEEQSIAGKELEEAVQMVRKWDRQGAF